MANLRKISTYVKVPRNTLPANRRGFDALLASPKVHAHLKRIGDEIATAARESARSSSRASQPSWKEPRFAADDQRRVGQRARVSVVTFDNYAKNHDRKYNTLTRMLHARAKGGGR